MMMRLCSISIPNTAWLTSSDWSWSCIHGPHCFFGPTMRGTKFSAARTQAVATGMLSSSCCGVFMTMWLAFEFEFEVPIGRVVGKVLRLWCIILCNTGTCEFDEMCHINSCLYHRCHLPSAPWFLGSSCLLTSLLSRKTCQNLCTTWQGHSLNKNGTGYVQVSLTSCFPLQANVLHCRSCSRSFFIAQKLWIHNTESPLNSSGQSYPRVCKLCPWWWWLEEWKESQKAKEKGKLFISSLFELLWHSYDPTSSATLSI